ncbi:MAG: hypothetical protein R6V19_05945, partial [Armatimonadota bacterium]
VFPSLREEDSGWKLAMNDVATCDLNDERLKSQAEPRLFSYGSLLGAGGQVIPRPRLSRR